MEQVTLADAKTRFDDLAARAAAGETITVTRDGRPVFVIAPAVEAGEASEVSEAPAAADKAGGIDWAAMERYCAERGIDRMVTWVSPDFDDPLPEDFLLRPLPPDP